MNEDYSVKGKRTTWKGDELYKDSRFRFTGEKAVKELSLQLKEKHYMTNEEILMLFKVFGLEITEDKNFLWVDNGSPLGFDLIVYSPASDLQRAIKFKKDPNKGDVIEFYDIHNVVIFNHHNGNNMWRDDKRGSAYIWEYILDPKLRKENNGIELEG